MLHATSDVFDLRRSTSAGLAGLRHAAGAGALLLAISLTGGQLAAQERVPAAVGAEVFAGSELEDYLRVLQLAGRAAPYPWSVRGFSVAEVEAMAPADTAHPWAYRVDFTGEGPGRRSGWIRPRAQAFFNSTFAHGGDGAVWAGRGVTGSVQAGGWARWGPASLTVAPTAFWSQNADFELVPTGLDGDGAFRNALMPQHIDLPQRFGSGPYSRLDAGESSLRLQLGSGAVGLSTARQNWGPMWRYPLIVSAESGGFAHLFVGTERPVQTPVGRVHGRLVYGRLEESAYSPTEEDEGARMMTGLLGVVTPRGMPGLEIGASRFFHRWWPARGPSLGDVLQPLETFLKRSLLDPDEREDNQLASVFFRWSFPASGFEVFGEYMREDHAFDARFLTLEPDDLSGYALGFARVWELEGNRLLLLRGELMNTETAHRQRGGSRDTGERVLPIYIHSSLRQGHTHRGRLLATSPGVGGGAAMVAVDAYSPAGSWSVEWERVLQRDRTIGLVPPGDGGAARVDVVHSLAVAVLREHGFVEWSARVVGTQNLNRHLAGDAFNLGLQLKAVSRWEPLYEGARRVSGRARPEG
jgi:hypothetical protein